jgi:hypothetical protein
MAPLKMNAEEFNAKHPVGTAVRYWNVLPPDPAFPPVETRTRTKAWTLGHGQPVVSIEGRTGGVDIEHLELSDPLLAATIWTVNKHGQKVAADPDSQDYASYHEATRDVIFLFQVLDVTGFNPEYLVPNQNAVGDGDGDVWIDTDMFNDDEIKKAKKDGKYKEENNEHRFNAILVDEDIIVEKGWATTTWRTESIWFKRAEAEAYAKAKAYKFGELGKGCRVFGECAEGRLAKLLSMVKNKDVEAFIHSDDFKTAYTGWRKKLTAPEVANA